MLKPVTIANKSWWAPKHHTETGLVEMGPGVTFRRAMEDKLARLLTAEAESEGFRSVLRQLKDRMPLSDFAARDPRDLAYVLMDESLVTELLDEMEESGRASLEEIQRAIEVQDEVDFGYFLQAVPLWWGHREG